MPTKRVLERTREYISENFLYARPDFVIGNQDLLLGRGIIDSLGVMEIVQFLADEFGVVVNDDEITEENLGTLASIASFVVYRLGTSAESIEPAA
jgi:acyl carrier protein